MTHTEAMPGGAATLAVTAPPAVDAGAPMTLRAAADLAPADPPGDRALKIRDAHGALKARLVMASADGPHRLEGEVRVTAPGTPGRHVWTATVARGGTAPALADARIAFEVTRHAVSAVVWDVPRAVRRGAGFRVRIGATCSSDCRAAGWTARVLDHEGRTVAEGRLGDAPWPGTEALRFAEIDLTAPDEEGLYSWDALVEARGADLPHGPGRREFGVRVAPEADALVRIEALDRERQTPVEGLNVFVHPFTGRTGPDGIAEVPVPRGTRRIMVSGKGYIPYRVETIVDGTETLRVELEPDRGLSDADIWA